MLPAMVPDDCAGRPGLAGGPESRGRSGDLTIWSMNTFDAGYACSKGIPTVMFGPGRRRFTGTEMLGDDSVSIADMWTPSRSSGGDRVVVSCGQLKHRNLCQRAPAAERACPERIPPLSRHDSAGYLSGGERPKSGKAELPCTGRY
jgi:hypothetical protein